MNPQPPPEGRRQHVLQSRSVANSGPPSIACLHCSCRKSVGRSVLGRANSPPNTRTNRADSSADNRNVVRPTLPDSPKRRSYRRGRDHARHALRSQGRCRLSCSKPGSRFAGRNPASPGVCSTAWPGPRPGASRGRVCPGRVLGHLRGSRVRSGRAPGTSETTGPDDVRAGSGRGRREAPTRPRARTGSNLPPCHGLLLAQLSRRPRSVARRWC